MICSRCKKRPAMVFVAKEKGSSNAQGLCLTCAKELGIKPVNDIINKMGISEDEINDMMEQFGGLIEKDDSELSGEETPFSEIMQAGSAAFPFLKHVFQGENAGEQNDSGNKQSAKGSVKEKKKSGKKQKRRYLDMYSCNLTEKARLGELDCVVGRAKEIDRTIQILSRRTKNNPCFIGEPGVGKTAIAEGLAIRIAHQKVPARLRGKEVHMLDMTAVVAGTQFRGQFESRMRSLIEEVKAEKNIILFIDEVHSLIGSGDPDGTMNAANILKPSLSRGEIQVIGATTFAEYRKYIEKDSALERRFQPIAVKEPSVSDTIEVLVGIRPYYEKYHRAEVSYSLIEKIAVLSERYIQDRFLPDKAIDLLDEACARASINNPLVERYDLLHNEISRLKVISEEIEEAGAQIDYEKLAEVRCDIARLEGKIQVSQNGAIKAEVTEDDVAQVLELWTGIPSSRIQENELKKLASLEDKLKQKIIGQDESVQAIASAIRRSRVKITPRRRPASFIFVGPTGVGKTELVKVLSCELFDMPESLIRLDMSEFMEKHAVSRIIGSPPGYVGYEESGQITEKVRQSPYSILLLDEIEKAHPDVMNILLQILDEGKITDAHGRIVNFENTVIVMTSNAGSDKKETALGFGRNENQLSKEKAIKAISDFLRPEFLSRIDEIIVFKNLDLNDFTAIAGLMLSEYINSLQERNISFEYDQNVTSWLAKKAIGGKSGARDLRNLIRKEVEDKITSMLIESQENIKRIRLYQNKEGQISLDIKY